MTKCVFCGKEESPYKGVHRINNNGSISFFCSSKCRKNALNLGREKNKLKWTEAYRIAKQKITDRELRDTAKLEAKNQESKK
ncbi:MAG TPA: 50S ribosomal protein L24e [Candidatus Nanoarchaeia archaeon]|nr:50S ribosomal protein L24e [Candidatus Nanoarchaeia archaeon]